MSSKISNEIQSCDTFIYTSSFFSKQHFTPIKHTEFIQTHSHTETEVKSTNEAFV